MKKAAAGTSAPTAARTQEIVMVTDHRGSVGGTAAPSVNGTGRRDRSFCNYFTEEVERAGKVVKVKVGYSASHLEGRLLSMTVGWPKRVGPLLFADAGGTPQYLDQPADLFAWIGRQLPESSDNRVHWSGGPTCVPKAEFFAHLQQTVESFDALESYPHCPALPGHFYLHPQLEGGDGKALRALLARYRPDGKRDAELLKSFLLTQVAGLAPGCRPAFLFTGPDDDEHAGRGVGKTAAVETLSSLVGGYVAVEAGQDMGQVKTRLLSPEARGRRVLLLDNLKTLKFSWAELEAFVTSDTISGKQNYVGEGRRPNVFTVALTINGASLSKDMALRSVIVKLARPRQSATWRERTVAFIEKNRWAILGDIVAELQRPAPALAHYCRWGAWEALVLARLSDPAALQALIQKRQADVDDDAAESDLVRGAIAEALVRGKFDPEGQAVLIPSQRLAVIVNDATGEKRPTNKVSAYLKTLAIPELRKSDRGGGRGWVWTGPGAGAGPAICWSEGW